MSNSEKIKWLKTTLQVLIFIAIISGGLVFAKHFVDTRPTVKRSRPKKQTPLVDIRPIKSTSKTVVIKAMGTVISSREISLYSELTGTVTWVSPNFVPGGKVKKGDILVRLDKKEYELEVKRQQSLVAQLQADLDLEKGQQEVARREMELMQKTLNRKIKNPKLALRVPQLNKALASLKSQQISMEQAMLDLERTTIKAPFNAIILDRTIDLGSRLTAQNALASLTSTDSFWIETAVPMNKLRWIKIPGLNGTSSSRVIVHLQDGSKAVGKVLRLLGSLNDKSQMARILVRVNDPLSMGKRKGKMPLLLNSYVSLDLSGSQINYVAEIPRSAIKDGNKIWMFKTNHLKIRTIDPIWEDENSIYVKNSFKAGELLITSDMSSAVDGMAVRPINSTKEPTRIADNRNQFTKEDTHPRAVNPSKQLRTK